MDHRLVVLALCVGFLLIAPAANADPADGTNGASPDAVFRGFIENQGQWQTDAKFVADFGGLLVRAEPGEIVLQQSVEMCGRPQVGVVRFAFEGDESAQPVSGERAPGEFHYFYGNDPSRWRRHVPAYRDLRYPIVGPGADVTLYQRDGHLEYDIEIPPGVDLESFVVRCEGISGITLEASGDLRLDTPIGPILQSAPVARQVTVDGQLLSATCQFRIVDSQHFGFTVPNRVNGTRLVVDPGLTWATFLGGAAGDGAGQVELRSDGRLAIRGVTTSRDFPTTAGVFEPTFGGTTDVVVTSLEPTGNALVFSTFIGGSAVDLPLGMSLSSDDSIAVVGYTASQDYPVLPDAYDTSFNGGLDDAFATILSADGSDLVLSTLMGGSCGESFTGVAFTTSGDVVAAGGSCSANFPVTPGAFGTTYHGSIGGGDGTVCRFDPSLPGAAQLVYSSYLGTSLGDQVLDLAMGPGDEPILVGTSDSTDFPTTPGAYEEMPGINFVTRFAADGSGLVASTHFKEGSPSRVIVDGDSILIAGSPGLNLPVSPDAYDSTWNGSMDCFVARFDLQLSRLIGATYLGGSRSETPHGLAVDPSGAILIVGDTDSDDYPTTLGAYDTVKGGPSGSITSMIAMLSPDLSQLLYSSFLGPAGAQTSFANGVVALGPADVVLVGGGALPGFPVTPGAYDETFNGGTLGTGDGYVARMLLEPLTWSTVGGALPGSNGTPTLSGTGDLVGGQPMSLWLANAKPATPTTLIAGLSLLNAPFKGGTLVPNPSILIFGLPTNGHGTLTLSATWPAGLPSGFAFFTQYWIPDSAGPAGFAASNGLAGITP